ncbi:UDP-N-acetylmuramoylalanyl-D-glutamate--2,6-diaminopimelate ligase [hydrothermal vent metagenome]|uniref:UDP-N-acetylmuramoylalanyl-D-glutamate--2,6-diaminopimelate ligase n=1 Tax=hydrothermal vent metagenome TaxID=652676 RepID=A0A3B1CZG1_9ZZZZ
MDINLTNLGITSITCDSRQVVPGAMFVACKGLNCQGDDFIDEAICKGAKVVVSEKKGVRHLFSKKVPDPFFLKVENSQDFLRQVARQFYGNPSEKIRVIGVTGTNGKTTVVYLIESILKIIGKKCGVIGTINHRIGDKVYPSHNTTPGFLENQQWLTRMVAAEVDYCLMEVSSHALDQERVDGIDFRQAIFTNLTDEHLDYHQTREKYFLAKAKLFKNLSKQAYAILNKDDAYCSTLSDMTIAKPITYGINVEADVMAKEIQSNIQGTCFVLQYKEEQALIKTRLIGNYNIYNILAAATVCLNEGLNLSDIAKGIASFSIVPGRLEPVECGQSFSIFIDYAHTPDALMNVFKTIRKINSSKIICVFGCGGDRDKIKRASMGKIASELADLSVVTSDNSRGENSQDIIDMIIKGFDSKNYKVIVDRKKAIEEALNLAKQDDVVLILGKGHEDYQIIGTDKLPFREKEIIQECLL